MSPSMSNASQPTTFSILDLGLTLTLGQVLRARPLPYISYSSFP